MDPNDFCPLSWPVIVGALRYDPDVGPSSKSFKYWDPPRDCYEMLAAVDFNGDGMLSAAKRSSVCSSVWIHVDEHHNPASVDEQVQF